MALPRDQMGTLAISITARGQGSLLLGPASSLVQVPVSPPLVLCRSLSPSGALTLGSFFLPFHLWSPSRPSLLLDLPPHP